MKSWHLFLVVGAVVLGGCSEKPQLPSPPQPTPDPLSTQPASNSLPTEPATMPSPTPPAAVQAEQDSPTVTLAPIVSSEEMAMFLEVVKRGGFHAMWKQGEQIFQQDRLLPEHAAQFKGITPAEPQPGQVRYTLYSFRGTSGAGDISILLEKSTGKILKFSRVETSF